MKGFSSVLLIVFMHSLLIVTGCERSAGFAGKYVSEDDSNQNVPKVNLELTANGHGIWAIEEDNVSFRWEARDDRILIHTKSGGVIIGKIDGNTVEISLPGMNVHRLKKIE
ncbi:MAG: hypothetical protein GY795_08760 [Desulfobacterales bacterium]|nr:hypothetical protein [Desulfobacterales bacterium]